MKISVVWWNTSFSPPRAKPGRVSSSDKEVFIELLTKFIVDEKVDLLGFCELSKKDVEWLEAQCAPYGYGVVSGIVRAGRANFDTCVFYRSEKLRFVEIEKHLSEELGRTTKIGLQYLFEILGDPRPLHLFTLHWPSRLNLSAWDPNRLTLGKLLRQPIQGIISSADALGEDALIVVMGDFNDEPYNMALTEGLFATRDRAMILKNHHLLYNPFWRKMGGRDSYSYALKDGNYSGTYYYSGSPSDRWRTFDQIIVSSAFVGKSNWHLIESETQIIDYLPYTNKVLDSSSKFDHLPIKVSLERI